VDNRAWEDDEFQFGLKQRLYNWTMRLARQRLGLKQEDLGRIVGVGQTWIANYETFRAWPRQEIAERIAQILGVPIESMFPKWLAEFRLKGLPESAEERLRGRRVK